MIARYLRYQAGYSMALWAMFLGLCLVPLFVLVTELSRLANVVSDIQQAADAAALAAVQEIDPALWEQLGEARFSQGAAMARDKAQEYLDRNATTAATCLAVTGAAVTPREDLGADLIKVEVSGTLRPLWLSSLSVTRVGIAAVRLRYS